MAKRPYLDKLVDTPVYPCPCCGSTDLHIGVLASTLYGIECQHCGVRLARVIPDRWSTARWGDYRVHTLKAALDAWNKRHHTRLADLPVQYITVIGESDPYAPGPGRALKIFSSD